MQSSTRDSAPAHAASRVEAARVPASVVAEESEYARWLAPVSVFAVIAIGRALQIGNGSLHPDALFWIAAAFTLVVGSVAVPRPIRFAFLDTRTVPLLALGGLFVHLGQLSTSPPGMYLRLEQGSLVPFHWGLAALAVVGGSVVWGAPRWAKPLQIGALVVAHFALGVWTIRHAPNPAIDVYVFHRDAIDALRAGIDPYGMTFQDIYRHAGFYGPGLSVGGRLQFGFPYLPLSLLVAVPGQLFGGDHRYAQLVAMELAAVLMAFARPRGFGPIAAVLFLTTPRIFFVLEQSWTEPFLVLGVAAVVFAACRYSRSVPWLFGAFIALKQYLVFALPAALMLLRWPPERGEIMRFCAKAALVGIVVTLPFVLWSPMGFWTSVVTLQLHQPFRVDALSFLAWWASLGLGQPPAFVAFLAMAIACLIAVWRLPKTAAGFGATIAVTFFAFFVFNKQAFCNYYFFVIGALSATLAAWRSPDDALVTGFVQARPWRPRLSALRAAQVALIAACLVPLVWPGDIAFINDEPLLIASAVRANDRGALAEAGLLGTFGFAYGPAPTWVYQVLMAITPNLVLVALLHAALMAATTAGALWWLSRSLGLWVWFAPVPLLSPYFWFYARVLWDNPFLIPLGALAIAGYAAHLRSGSAAGLRVSLASIVTIPCVHLMGLALVIPLAVHLVVVRWRALWAHRFSVAAIVLVPLAMAWPYWTYLATHRSASSVASASLDGWIFPLAGGRLLSARGLEYFYGPGPVGGAVFGAAAAVSWLAYALVWAGIAVGIWYVVHAIRSRRWTPRAHLALILLASLACQAALDGLSAKFEHPHYQNGTWIAFALLSWFAVDFLAERRSPLRWSAVAATATALLAGALLTTVGMLAYRLHRTGGTRELYGPTIANQQRVARALARYSSRSPLQIEVSHYRRFPHTLAILRQLNAEGGNDGPEQVLELRYASDDPGSGVIELVER